MILIHQITIEAQAVMKDHEGKMKSYKTILQKNEHASMLNAMTEIMRSRPVPRVEKEVGGKKETHIFFPSPGDPLLLSSWEKAAQEYRET